MEFRTGLKKYKKQEFIDYSQDILLVGSCFVEHVNRYLSNRKYNSFLNPCGISYNPTSIANSIYYTHGLLEFDPDSIRMRDEISYHFDFHGNFNSLSKKETKINIQSHLAEAKKFKTADIVILSLGTAFYYRRIDNDEVVNNCHKIESSFFSRERLLVTETVNVLKKAIDLLINTNPECKILLTVSPVRHFRDGLIENNLSKATLLLACEILCNSIDQCYYFPSYELVIDDLRDYRFFEKDLVHPNQMAVDYVMDFFETHWLKSDQQNLRSKVLHINKRLEHRSFHPKSEAHQRFLRALWKDIHRIMEDYPFDFSQELILLEEQLAP